MDITLRAARIEESYRFAEQIAAKRKPHLFRVATLFPDRARYLAFCAAYASMRWVDDHVDELAGSLEELEAWQEEVYGNYSGIAGTIIYGPALADSFRKFELPLEPWLNMKKSMQQDLEQWGYASYQDFLVYAEGATVAPAAVFASLLLQRRSGALFHLAVPYETIRDAVREAAILCYEAHIVRDLKEDLSAGRNYFPVDELQQFGLENEREAGEKWRPYLLFYMNRTAMRRERALEAVKIIETEMTPRERLMLHLLVEFYISSLEKSIRLEGDVWSDRHWIEKDEMKALLERLKNEYEAGAALEPLAIKAIEDV